MSDKRSTTSAENGKKGGRPISEATIRAQEARDYISQQVKDSLGAIVAKAVTQAIEGDSKAREWLSSYSWGKPAINLGVTDTGEPIPLLVQFLDGTDTSEDPK
jgi:hypothetical protein